MAASATRQSRSRRHRNPTIDIRSWLVAPAAAVLIIAFIYPVFHFLLRSFSDPVWGLQNFLTLIDQPIFERALANTVVVSGTVTLFCVVLGYPLAYTIANAGPRLRRLLVFAVLVPFWSSLLVRTFAWMVLLQQNGLINHVLLNLGLTDAPVSLIYNRIGVVIGMVHILLPFMILPLYSVLLRIDPSYTSAAASLGAPPVSSFLRVYLPLSLPGVLTGTMLVFVIGLGYFITPALLGGPGDTMIAQIIAMEVSDFGRWGLAGAVALVLLLGTSVIFVLVQRFLTTPR
jgi:putative spermidine/putrescine transport system permease protein